MTAPTDKKRSDEEIIQSMSTKYSYGWHDSDTAGQAARRGLDEDVVRHISATKNEPEWMLEQRLKAMEILEKKPIPKWGPDLSFIDFDEFKYFVRSTEKPASSWEELPDDIRNTYDKLGIPEAEKQRRSALSVRSLQRSWPLLEPFQSGELDP